jgi:hypothetical protein
MLASVCRVVIPAAKSPTFIQHCEREVLPKFKSAAGLLNVALWHRTCIGYAEVQIVFTWQSSSAMRQFPGDDFLQEIRIHDGYIIIPEQSFSCYDVLVLG